MTPKKPKWPSRNAMEFTEWVLRKMHAWIDGGCDPERLPAILHSAIGLTIWAGMNQSKGGSFTTFTPKEDDSLWVDDDWSVIVVNRTDPNYKRALAVLSGAP